MKISQATGLPVVYPYHGMLLNHDLKEISATEENIKNLLAHYLDAVAGQSKSSPSAAAALRSRVHQRAEPKAVEALLNMRVGAALLANLDAATQVQYQGMLRVIEAWALSKAPSDAPALRMNDPKVLSAIKELGLPPPPNEQEAAAQPMKTSYIDQCRAEKVPIPPDWGSPEWQFQGVLARKYVFAPVTDGPNEVWAAVGKDTKGVCMALPRKDLKTGDTRFLGIICQSKETGKACFWDNIDRKTELNITGEAVNGMKISSIQDGSMLKENCTNCHRGYNVFVIHPGTALDIGDRFDLHPDKRYQPIGQPTWGNPAPLIERGRAPCGSCHEIPGLRDDNDEGQTLPSAYCKTVLQKSVDLTMPYVGSPAKWNSAKPGYEAHIKFLKARCESQSVAGK